MSLVNFRHYRNVGLLFALLLGSGFQVASPGKPTVLSESPAAGAHGLSQSAADVIREFSGAEVAFLAAGLVKDAAKKDDLSTLLEYPSDTLVVVELTGAQIRTALERSVASYPDPSISFLQLSGLEFSFNKSKPADQRVAAATIAGAKLEDNKSYVVALPSSLHRGQLGYSKLWDKAKVLRTYDKVTLGDVLRGKRASETSPRVVVSG